MSLARSEILLRRAVSGLARFQSYKNLDKTRSIVMSSSVRPQAFININSISLNTARPLNLRFINTSSPYLKRAIIGKDEVDYTEFEKFRKDKNALLIDVRNPEELINAGEIPNTINIPLPNIRSFLLGEDTDKFEENFGVPLPKQGDPIIVFCKIGKRSETARQLLTTGLGSSSYNNVANYKGSFDDWSAKNAA